VANAPPGTQAIQLQNTVASILHEIAMPADETLKPTQAEIQSVDKMLKEGGNESWRQAQHHPLVRVCTRLSQDSTIMPV